MGSYAAQPQHNDSYIIKSIKEHDLIIGFWFFFAFL